MTKPAFSDSHPVWGQAAQGLFRVATVFFVLLAVPLDWKYWRAALAGHGSFFQELFQLTVYTPQFLQAPRWGLGSYANLGVALAVAVAGGLVWTVFGRPRDNYRREYYWLRVILRYRLALAIIGYGVIKVFPLQFPAPTLSDLNTEYGDFLPWKIYYLTNAVAGAHYLPSLGLLEILGGLLLLWRQTTVIGAGLIAAILTNVVLANYAYDLGDHVYAFTLLLLALALVAHDVPRLFNLLSREKPARADRSAPVFASAAGRAASWAGRAAVALFLLAYGAAAHAAFVKTQWPLPASPGLAGAAGYYNVREFTINGQTLPYSLVDPVRWQNVVFEKWNTVSIRINRPIKIAVANPPIAGGAGEDRTYEFAGNGGRHFYGYDVEAGSRTLRLRGKNDPQEALTLQFSRLPGGALLLTGKDQAGDDLRVVLEKVDKQYLLEQGRRKPITIY